MSAADGRPFVVTVASEKGGVGKTTIATNLAVYLKALEEDLPVAIASFDNHFIVDGMFALGETSGGTVAGLFSGTPPAELVRLGQFGVEYFVSDRSLVPPDDDPCHLKSVLSAGGLPGILLLDTRPVLDYFTCNALHAADLVLVPVRDRASLVNAAALVREVRGRGGDPSRIWLLPSIIDPAYRIQGGISLGDYMTFAGRERGYQVLETVIERDSLVEGLASGFSSRIYPVLTRARTTAVHGQLREIADFVLRSFRSSSASDSSGFSSLSQVASRLSPVRRHRLQEHCPWCNDLVGREGHYFFDLRSRREGFVHASCISDFLQRADLGGNSPEMLIVETTGAGFSGPETEMRFALADGKGVSSFPESIPNPEESPFAPIVQGAGGRSLGELYREWLFLSLEPVPVADALLGDSREVFQSVRRKAMRELLGG